MDKLEYTREVIEKPIFPKGQHISSAEGLPAITPSIIIAAPYFTAALCLLPVRQILGTDLFAI